LNRHDRHPDVDALFEQLGRRIRAGDREAFTEVFHALHEPLVRYSRSITGEDSSAYDVLQDVFLKLWERREELIAHTSLRSMLYAMVRNASLNVRRNRMRRGELQEATPRREEEAPGADARLSAADLSVRIRKWIDDLPERRAEAFRLSRYAGLSHAEIGRIMNVSERTVGTHILLALRYLRSRLDDFEHLDAYDRAGNDGE